MIVQSNNHFDEPSNTTIIVRSKKYRKTKMRKKELSQYRLTQTSAKITDEDSSGAPSQKEVHRGSKKEQRKTKGKIRGKVVKFPAPLHHLNR